MKPPRKPHTDLFAGGAVVLGGIGTIIYAIGIIGWQCLTWLREAIWYPIPISYALPAPVTKYAGVNVILNWLVDLHASIPLVIIGGIAISCGLGLRETAQGSYKDAQERFQETMARTREKLSQE